MASRLNSLPSGGSAGASGSEPEVVQPEAIRVPTGQGQSLTAGLGSAGTIGLALLVAAVVECFRGELELTGLLMALLVCMPVSAVFVYLAFVHSRWDASRNWVEFGGAIRHSRKSQPSVHMWDAVSGIRCREGDDETSPEIQIELDDGTVLSLWVGLPCLNDIAEHMVARLDAADPDVRRRAVVAMGKLGLTTFGEDTPLPNGYVAEEPAWLTEMFANLAQHLERASNDADEGVRRCAQGLTDYARACTHPLSRNGAHRQTTRRRIPAHRSSCQGSGVSRGSCPPRRSHRRPESAPG